MRRLLVPIFASVGVFASVWAFQQHIRLNDIDHRIHIADITPWAIAGSAIGSLAGLIVCDRQSRQTERGIQKRLEAASQDLGVPLEDLSVLMAAREIEDVKKN